MTNFIPENSLLWNTVFLVLSFVILTKSADFLVDGAVGIAYQFKVPKIIIGIVLVGFATTAPEFTVSMISALEGKSEIALGNAVGSVIADNGLALALGILVAPAVIIVHARTLKIYGFLLLAVSIIVTIFVADTMIGRGEGIFLLAIMALYMVFVFVDEKKRKQSLVSGEPPVSETAKQDQKFAEEVEEEEEKVEEELEEHIKPGGPLMQFGRFMIGVAGVILAGRFLVTTAVNMARIFHVSEAIIGLTIVAIGTSLPEIATCILASRKGHGDLALGDIMGANLLNIMWIVGAAATANPITVSKSMILFSFPSMIIFIVVLLLFARLKYRLEEWKGVMFLVLYFAYAAIGIYLFYIKGIETTLV